MKWYFAISEASIGRDDHDWENLVYSSVRSAKRNTTLSPHLLYDGEPSDFTRNLERLGVTVIRHRVSFYDELIAHGRKLEEQGRDDGWWSKIATGCFLRFDIPIIEKDDAFVLYTDCDVTFLRDPDVVGLRPPFFAVAPEGQIDDYGDMNSGVMVINLDGMRKTYLDLVAFTVKSLEGKLDQDILREFYKGWYDKLSHQLNWKPYWGISQNVQIVHWHGPKPVAIEKMLMADYKSPISIWNQLYDRSRDGYRHYLELWKRELTAD